MVVKATAVTSWYHMGDATEIFFKKCFLIPPLTLPLQIVMGMGRAPGISKAKMEKDYRQNVLPLRQ